MFCISRAKNSLSVLNFETYPNVKSIDIIFPLQNYWKSSVGRFFSVTQMNRIIISVTCFPSLCDFAYQAPKAGFFIPDKYINSTLYTYK